MKLTHGELAQLLRSLGTLLHAGLSLADGVYLLSQEESGDNRMLLEALGNSMDQGLPLLEAMELTGAFPEEALGMIRVGQTTGRLEQTLFYLADFYDRQVRTARQVKNALLYPSLILALMLLVLFVLLTEVLPVFDRVYASLGSSLTGFAGWLLTLGQGMKTAMPILLGVLAVCLVCFLTYKLVNPLRERINRFVLTRFGDVSLARKFHNAQFAQAMAMGLGSGLGLDESVSLAKKLLAHIPAAKARCEKCEVLLSQDEPLAKAMGQAGLLPPAMSRILAVSLQSGAGDKTMADIARRLDADAQESLEDAVSRIEPALVLVCSVLVGAVLLAVMLPLMNILSTIG